MQEKERVVFVDYVRVVAPLLVMLVHASENFYAADSSGLAGSASMLANESNRFWVAFWDGGVSRCCVPLFMMISAYLLVPMKSSQTMSSFYKRRFLHILPPFITFLVAGFTQQLGIFGSAVVSWICGISLLAGALYVLKKKL